MHIYILIKVRILAHLFKIETWRIQKVRNCIFYIIFNDKIASNTILNNKTFNKIHLI